MSEDAMTDDWWISDGALQYGGTKVMGPFASRALALEVRSLYEASTRANGLTYWVSRDPAGPHERVAFANVGPRGQDGPG